MTAEPSGSRVGWGFDAHRLDGSPPLVLGGVTVSDSIGVSATSDGDVLAHAVIDAVLGACA
ncbi:MAG TPA: 2-C-methyl-D-erythritol 2,4-cyclodiphosphate synthase, partial [Acidimicrobiia bacterium]